MLAISIIKCLGCLFDVSVGTLVFITFKSVDEYLLVTLVSGSQLLVEHDGNAGKRKEVIGGGAKMTINNADWHQLNIEFHTGFVSVALQHEHCSNQTLCFTDLPVAGSEMEIYIGSMTENVRSYVGFIGCMRDIRVNSDWLTPSWLAANQNASANVSGSCGWSNNCAPDPCNGRGLCTDLWTHSICTCRSPFWGLTCSKGMRVLLHLFY